MHGISAIDVDASVKSRQTPATQMGQGGRMVSLVRIHPLSPLARPRPKQRLERTFVGT